MKKRCSKCGEEKEIEEFYKKKNTFYSPCKQCFKIINKASNDKYNKNYYKKFQELAKEHNLPVKSIQYYGFKNVLTAFQRENWKCETCKTSEKLIVHHKDGSGISNKNIQTNNNPDNLRVLCESCHSRLHNKGKKRKGSPWKKPKLREKVICHLCKKEFETTPSKAKKAKFCSQECARVITKKYLKQYKQ